ncbi:hypothetical protein CCU68_06765 [Pseudomonas gingeri NCPPB 3146 = LMG 5327]|uniref:Uncharacterized protein n=1 Tax=Pseudomonas gingeri NCPPB 3146 = LMG 5327 TaxID=707248 RepID=A0ABX4Y8L8_9PSED|nr:hypothetical protein CCU68_06765 [Pseudomonas gingeri NCPPB 3146 = LMG 5327]
MAAQLKPPWLIAPTLRVGMPLWTLRVRCASDAERHGRRAHAERGNDRCAKRKAAVKPMAPRLV